MSAIRRNSGAILHNNVVLKRPDAEHCGDLWAQAAKMEDYPWCFVRVFCKTLDDGYAMEQGFAPRQIELRHMREALALLERLWQTPAPEYAKQRRRPISLDAYHGRSMATARTGEPSPDLETLVERAEYLFGRFGRHPLNTRRVRSFHGDATLDNVVQRYEGALAGDIRWIDPSTREVPLDAELDVAKVLQSVLGYNDRPDYLTEDARRFAITWIRQFDPIAVVYYFHSHLLRMWPIQPQKADWMVSASTASLDYITERQNALHL